MANKLQAILSHPDLIILFFRLGQSVTSVMYVFLSCLGVMYVNGRVTLSACVFF
jgi:hypothetical protein